MYATLPLSILVGLAVAQTTPPASSPDADPAVENRKVFPAMEPKAKPDLIEQASQKAQAREAAQRAAKAGKKVKKKPKAKSTLLPDPIPKTAWGTTSNTEADLLWTDARESFAAGKYEDAAGKFRRLQDRYPSYSFYSLLPFWLGETALRLEDWDFARKQLRSYILNEPHSRASLAARFELARVFVAKKQMNDAYLTSLEILDALKKVKGLTAKDPHFEAAAFLIRAEGLIAVNDWKRADLSVQSAVKLLPKTDPSPEPSASASTEAVASTPTPSATPNVPEPPPPLSNDLTQDEPVTAETQAAPTATTVATAAASDDAEATPSPLPSVAPPLPQIPELSTESLRIRASWTALRIAIHGCERYPTAARLPEDQVLDQLDRRGDCLIQAFSYVRQGVRVKPQPVTTDRILSDLLDTYQAAWQAYFRVSDKPPSPPGPRNAKQLDQYRFELSDKLLQRAHLKRLQLLDLSKPITLPEEGLSETRIRQVRTMLRNIEKMGRS